MRRFFTDRTPPDLAATYDSLAPQWLSRWSRFESRLVSEQWRNDYVSQMHGDVLELGIAAGDTLMRLKSGSHKVRSYTGIDFSPGMIVQSRKAADGVDIPIDLQVASAEQMPMFADNQFDTVAAGLVFCTIPDVGAALAEVKRVLKPDGRMVLVEHVLSPNPVVGWGMKRFAPLQVRQMGCNIDREIVQTLHDHGFIIEQHRKRILGIFRYIVATPPR